MQQVYTGPAHNFGGARRSNTDMKYVPYENLQETSVVEAPSEVDEGAYAEQSVEETAVD